MGGLLIKAELEWRDGQPYSTQWQDIYFSCENGLNESRYVFLQHNHLPQRWSAQSPFTIIETGFGSGLNFLATWQLWLQTASATQRLHYIGVDRYPLAIEDLSRIWSQWPELVTLSAELLAQYPPLVKGFHRLHFASGNVTLTLIFADVKIALNGLKVKADAWYLDGFDPAKNPDMWQLSLFQQMAGLLKTQATFATFTAAGHVRRNLQAAGFCCEKVKGYAKKREMLTGYLPQMIHQNSRQPWYDIPLKSKQPAHAVVIGAGVSGAACAYQLAQRGWQVTVLDQSAQAASEASGNPAGVIMPVLTTDDSAYGQFYLHCYLYALQQLKLLQKMGLNWHQCGVLQLASTDRQVQRQQQIIQQYTSTGLVQAYNSAQASAWCGEEVAYSGILYPDAGWLMPQQLCQILLSNSAIQCQYGIEVKQLQPTANGWQVIDSQGEIILANIVILAVANNVTQFTQTENLPLTPARGQLSIYPQPKPTQLKGVVCDKGYIIPMSNNYCVGATYQLNDMDSRCRDIDHQHNKQQLSQYLSILAAHLGKADGRASLRATTPDRLPLIGAVPDDLAFKSQYADLRHGKPVGQYTAGTYWSGLYVAAGHGSRGLMSSLLGAELLVSHLMAEPLPLPETLLHSVNPARFLVRHLKSGGQDN